MFKVFILTDIYKFGIIIKIPLKVKLNFDNRTLCNLQPIVQYFFF